MVDPDHQIKIVANQIIHNEATLAKYGCGLINENSDDPFWVCNLQECLKRYKDFERHSPRVEQFYALKCNPDPIICKALATVGCGFECASKKEIAQVVGMGVKPDKIIFMHPTKVDEYLRFAENHKVAKMSFDSEAELIKMKNIYPEAEGIVRILSESKSSMQSLGKKFGCSVEDAKKLIEFGKKLGSNIIGVTFHVGVGCLDIEAFGRGIKSIRELFDFAETVGYKFNMVNIGGGFPGEAIDVAKYSAIINEALEKYFPESKYPNLVINSEFGQYYVTAALTMFNEVIGKTKRNLGANQIGYFINESVFNSLVSAYSFSPQYFKTNLINPEKYVNRKKYDTIIYGNMPEKYDTINKGNLLPELDVGDWVYFHNAGGYTIGRKREFTMTPMPKIHFICDNESYKELISDTKLKLFNDSDFQKF